MLELQPIGSTYPICEGYKLGQKVRYKGSEEWNIKPFDTEIVGIDLTTFATGQNLVMLKYRNGKRKVTESNFNSGLQIVYCKDVYFLWAKVDEIEVV